MFTLINYDYVKGTQKSYLVTQVRLTCERFVKTRFKIFNKSRKL